MKGYKGPINTRRGAEKIVARIYGDDVSVGAVDAGKDIQISAGFLKSVFKVLAEESSGEKAIIGDASRSSLSPLLGTVISNVVNVPFFQMKPVLPLPTTIRELFTPLATVNRAPGASRRVSCPV